MPRSNSPSKENTGTPGTAPPQESQAEAAQGAREMLLLLQCLVRVIPREQENVFHYNANKSTAALLNPTVHPRTRDAALCPSCSAHSLPSTGGATRAALLSVPIAELCPAAWTCCAFPAALNVACCPSQHSSTGTNWHTGPGKRHTFQITSPEMLQITCPEVQLAAPAQVPGVTVAVLHPSAFSRCRPGDME